VRTGTLDWVGFADFENSTVNNFQLEEGTDESREDIIAITQALRDFGGSSSMFYDELGMLIDWEHFHRHIAAEQWTGHIDGYALNTNNYRVYFDPADGLADFITWDLDYAFINDWEWGFSWNNPTGGIISDYCENFSNCWNEGQKDAMSDLLGRLEGVDLIAYLEEILALINERALSDPKRECSTGNVTSYQNDMRRWINNRDGEMRDFWGL
jgi:spore coat protein CotH